MSEARQVQMRAVSGDEAGLRLDRWFQRHFPELSHGALQKLLRTGQVRLDGKRVEGKDRVEPGQTVRLPPGVTAAPVPSSKDKPKAAKPRLSERVVGKKKTQFRSVRCSDAATRQRRDACVHY